MSEYSHRILIIRLSSIGDILLSTPFIRQVRVRYPNAKIDFIIKKEFVELIRFNPHLNQITMLDNSRGNTELRRLRRQIKKGGYDYIFDLHNNIRSNLLTAFIKNGKIFRIKKNKIKRTILVKTGINLYKDITPIPQRYLQVGSEAGIEDDEAGLEIFWKDFIEEIINNLTYKWHLHGPYMVVAPGAGFFTKRWPIEKFEALIERIIKKYKCKIVVLGGKSEIKQIKALDSYSDVINLTGKLTLLESAIVTNNAKMVLSNDTGMMHMAAAVKTPVVAIFGSTVKEFGFFPYRCENVVIENVGLNCRPCTHMGRDRCPRGHFKCMDEIGVNEVYNQVIKYL